MRKPLTAPIGLKRPPGSLDRDQVQSQLERAIRDGDVQAARRALAAGATSICCTLDHEGYHTPTELALKHGRAEIAEALTQVE